MTELTPELTPELTIDSLHNGCLQIQQSPSGYRFSMDAVIIANIASIQSNDRVLDLGTGCGVIPLILAYLHLEITVFGVEIQKSQADIAAANVRNNHLENRITIFHQDIKSLSVDQTSGNVNVVICNPPHIEKSCGRINPDRQLAVSRHEIEMTLDDVVKTAKKMLSPFGRLILIYPAKRLADLTDRMRSCGIEPKKICILYTKAETKAKRVIIEGIKDGKPGMVITKPLIIHNPDGTYTEMAKRIFSTQQ
ncbi:MAG: tRNA1(Val) (adenine(37)-N6)-methyltransferase [Desulfobacteraceae bacterium]|jgi:tRNA1Val (adenine37-N6)-methyltransferase|nr:tRNA1(Val) (adenine(37)-N6)-methyltransferase [Desulfobacteraceae bacterium]